MTSPSTRGGSLPLRWIVTKITSTRTACFSPRGWSSMVALWRAPALLGGIQRPRLADDIGNECLDASGIARVRNRDIAIGAFAAQSFRHFVQPCRAPGGKHHPDPLAGKALGSSQSDPRSGPNAEERLHGSVPR